MGPGQGGGLPKPLDHRPKDMNTVRDLDRTNALSANYGASFVLLFWTNT